MTRPSPVAGPDPSDTTHRPFSLSLANSQPEKSEATSDNEGDPAHPHRYRPVPDDDGPLHENPRQVKQRYHGEDHPPTRENVFGSMSHHPKSLTQDSTQGDDGCERRATDFGDQTWSPTGDHCPRRTRSIPWEPRAVLNLAKLRSKGVSSARWSRRAMIASPLLQHAAVAALAALAITWPGMVSAWAQAQSRDSFSRTSPSGSYLAARHAGGQRDAAAAASYYRAALRADPGNNELLGRAFLAVLANGEADEGVKLAERVLQVDKNDRIARLVLGVRAIKQKQYPVARRELAQSISGPITALAATLLSAWTMASPSEARQATDAIDKLGGEDWYANFKDLHAALILDLAGQKREAAKRFERSYKLDPKALRVVQSYPSFLSRQGNTVDAVKVLAAFDEVLPRHPL